MCLQLSMKDYLDEKDETLINIDERTTKEMTKSIQFIHLISD